MKIAQVVCTYPPYRGGIGNSAYEFSKYLRSYNLYITTFTPDYGGEKEDDSAKRLKPILKYGNAAFVPQLFFRLCNFDVIFLHFPFFGAVEIIWLFMFLLGRKKRLVIHYHMDTPGLSFVARILSIPTILITHSLFKKASIITCASLDYVEHSSIAKIYKKNKQKFIEIPFGVDTARFKPQKKEQDCMKKILFVGGLDKAHYFKGVSILLRALACLEVDNWALDIVGGGDLIENYKNEARGLGIADKINFLGKVDNDKLSSVYAQSDFLILPSINKGEAFGIVLIEAMSSGLAVIASDLPGVRGVFKQGKHGFLAKPGDIEDLRRKIKELVVNEEKLLEMKKQAREYAKEKYDWNKNIKKLINVFRKNA